MGWLSYLSDGFICFWVVVGMLIFWYDWLFLVVYLGVNFVYFKILILGCVSVLCCDRVVEMRGLKVWNWFVLNVCEVIFLVRMRVFLFFEELVCISRFMLFVLVGLW